MIKKIKINGRTYRVEGKSAYEIAVEHGFQGTEEEWLESLNGEGGGGADYSAEIAELQQDRDALTQRVDFLEKVNLGNTYDFQQVETLALRQDVPINALEIATLDKIGGYTKGCKNLLKLLYDPNNVDENGNTPLHTEYVNGATYAVTKEGYLCINGMGDISTNLQLDVEKMLVSQPSTVTISAKYIKGTADTDAYGNSPTVGIPHLDMDNGFTSISKTVSSFSLDYFTIMAVGTFNNYQIALMIEEGTTATEYEPYFEGLKSAKVRAVKSYGRNLVPPDIYESENWDNDGWLRYTLPGVPFDGDYTLTVKKNPNKDWGSAIISLFVSKNGGSSWAYPDGWGDAYMITSNQHKSPVTLSLKKGDILRLSAYPTTQETIDKIMDVQFERGSKATAYVPYVGLIGAYDVPDGVQALDGYGANETYIDFGARAFVNGETVTPIAEITDTVYLMVEGGGYIVAENNEGLEAPLTMTYQVKL